MYFIAGMLFIYCVIPLLEGILSLITTWLGKIETKQAAQTYNIKQAATADEDDTKKVVGFVYEEEEEKE